jgi:hypothetical protein
MSLNTAMEHRAVIRFFALNTTTVMGLMSPLNEPAKVAHALSAGQN